MAGSTESAHVRWLLSEYKRLQRVLDRNKTERQRLLEVDKETRKLMGGVNTLIALYGATDPPEAVAPADRPARSDEDAVEGGVACPECGKFSKTKAAVGTHMRTVHGIRGGLSGRVRTDDR
jgi:hypothetical protein